MSYHPRGDHIFHFHSTIEKCHQLMKATPSFIIKLLIRRSGIMSQPSLSYGWKMVLLLSAKVDRYM